MATLTQCLPLLVLTVIAVGVALALAAGLRREQGRAAALARRLQRLEQDHAEQARHFETVTEQMESFSSSVSHDLRSPIRVSEGFARILLEDYGSRLDDLGRGHLRRILAAAERMNAMIDALLTMSRRTSAPLEPVDVDLARMAREITQDLQASGGASRVRFEIPAQAVAHADPALARIVLQNLLANAAKFSSQAPEPRVEFGAESRDGVCGWFVRDNGAGFDMRFAGRLFEPFQRLHSQSEYPGTGIGLATVARAVRRHGGRIWAEAQPAQGACFHFTLAPQRAPAVRDGGSS